MVGTKDQKTIEVIGNKLFSRSLWIALACQVGLMTVAALIGDQTSPPMQFSEWMAYWASFLSLTLSIAAIASAAAFSESPKEQIFWVFIGSALSIAALGEFIENINYLREIEHILDFNDAFFLSAKLVIIVMQLSLIRDLLRRKSMSDMIYDFIASLTAVGIILWFFFTVGKEADTASLSDHDLLALGVYVFFDIVIIFNCLTLSLRSVDTQPDISHLALIVIFLGLFSLSASDLNWAIDKVYGRTISSNSISSLLANVSYILISFGIILNARTRLRGLQRTKTPQWELLEDIAPFAQVLASLVLIYLLGRDYFQPGGNVLFLALAFLVFILLVRQSGTYRQQLKLKTQLAVSATEVRLANWYRQEGAGPHSPRQSPESLWLSDSQAKNDTHLAYWSKAENDQLLSHIEDKSQNLASAIALDWFQPWYQPIHNVEEASLVSVEMLARCHHPNHGLLMPGDFIPDVESTNLGAQLLRHLLPNALKDLKRMIQSGSLPQNASLAVNMTAQDFKDPQLAADVRRMLDDASLQPHQLILELTERMVVDDHSFSAFGWRSLRDSGVKFSIDDFGTGYSSLAYLDQFQPDIVKIDRRFIDQIDERDSLVELVASILDMTRRLGIQVIVEGVERPAQLACVRRLGARLIQGYMLSEPMTADTLCALAPRLRKTEL